MGALATKVLELEHVPLALKGQITGPVSWGLSVIDRNQRPILYDEVLADAVGKHLRLKASWQERKLRQLGEQLGTEHTIMFVDEPYMASFGSRFVSLSRQQVVRLLEEVFAGLRGLKGVHCCGNTDWSLLVNTSVDILSLDAYDYAETLVRYASDVAQFLERGGIIAWGIVPASVLSQRETVDSIVGRLRQAIDRLADSGVPRDAIMRASLVSPSCTLEALPPGVAEHVLDLTVGVSDQMRGLHLTLESG